MAAGDLCWNAQETNAGVCSTYLIPTYYVCNTQVLCTPGLVYCAFQHQNEAKAGQSICQALSICCKVEFGKRNEEKSKKKGEKFVCILCFVCLGIWRNIVLNILHVFSPVVGPSQPIVLLIYDCQYEIYCERICISTLGFFTASTINKMGG